MGSSQNRRVLTLTDMKEAFQDSSKQQTQLQNLKQKLDGLVATEVECETVFDHEYTSPETVHCIIYYLAGFMCQKLLKCTTCPTCRGSLIEETALHAQPESILVQCKTRGRLLHPNRIVFCLLKAAEIEFEKHATCRNAYELTIENLLENYRFAFPCVDHKEDIMAQLLHHYIAMRMRQLCKQKKI